MSHQRYPSHDVVKEPHAISLKVLRLSRPSLVAQYPLAAPLSAAQPPPTVPASVAYDSRAAPASAADTNTDPFLLSPLLNLPPSFGSAYVGETFACTLCVNHDVPGAAAGGGDGEAGGHDAAAAAVTAVRDVRMEAEMKTPSAAAGVVVPLALTPEPAPSSSGGTVGGGVGGGVDLAPGQTLQKIVRFDLKEEGNHVLAVTVSYYEATATSGRTRTFRKLYQFICKASLIVRTKAGPYGRPTDINRRTHNNDNKTNPYRRWVLEAQLENCGEDVIQLERVGLDLEPALAYTDCNGWAERADDGSGSGSGGGGLFASPSARMHGSGSGRPVLHPGEVEQVSFLLEETAPGLPPPDDSGRLVFGVLGIGWRGEMGNRGYLSTGKLGTRSLLR
ncbi:DUF974 domain containing protein [Niveomyces insectorum RCEF 264]|uniref:DUF974 domain containing protein n=1 Tax=Niveomyces insectorum RCEF 264 TaxID=1081102 RepID=A0A167NUI5_9HYPO|nr:DUF974 domain containing protein [Niveomyces insectorum RCEF 264]